MGGGDIIHRRGHYALFTSEDCPEGMIFTGVGGGQNPETVVI